MGHIRLAGVIGMLAMSRLFYLCWNPQSVTVLAVLKMGLVLAVSSEFIGDSNPWPAAAQDSIDNFCRSSLVYGDLDGNGFEDLVIGCPSATVNDIAAGAVYVFYSEASGLTPAQRDLWHPNSPGIDREAAEGDAFGTAVAVGDFNADGVDDLAIGAPGVGGGQGQVRIIFGSRPNGLISAGNLLFINTFGFAGAYVRFGAALEGGTSTPMAATISLWAPPTSGGALSRVASLPLSMKEWGS